METNAAPAPKAVTAKDVLRWAQDAGWDQATALKLEGGAIARHCNRASRENQNSQSAALQIDKFRLKIADVRHLGNRWIAKTTELVADLETWTHAQQDSSGLAELMALLATVNEKWPSVEPFLAPVRRRGGRNAPWSDFVGKLDIHLTAVLAPPPVPATTASPLTAFMLSAVEAVFGVLDTKGEGKDLRRTIAKLIVGLRKARKNTAPEPN